MIFEIIRKLTCNFTAIEKYVPIRGDILDVGCGHGIFSKLLIDKSPDRNVLGIDPSEKKITLAKTNYLGIENLNFKKSYVDKIKRRFDAIVVIDVIYLFPPKDKLRFLKTLKKLLKPTGKVILVINGTEPRWIHNLLILQENIMQHFVKITYSDFDRTYFENKGETIILLEKAGLKIENIVSIKSLLPYPHSLFLASQK